MHTFQLECMCYSWWSLGAWRERQRAARFVRQDLGFARRACVPAAGLRNRAMATGIPDLETYIRPPLQDDERICKLMKLSVLKLKNTKGHSKDM